MLTNEHKKVYLEEMHKKAVLVKKGEISFSEILQN